MGKCFTRWWQYWGTHCVHWVYYETCYASHCVVAAGLMYTSLSLPYTLYCVHYKLWEYGVHTPILAVVGECVACTARIFGGRLVGDSFSPRKTVHVTFAVRQAICYFPQIFPANTVHDTRMNLSMRLPLLETTNQRKCSIVVELSISLWYYKYYRGMAMELRIIDDGYGASYIGMTMELCVTCTLHHGYISSFWSPSIYTELPNRINFHNPF